MLISGVFVHELKAKTGQAMRTWLRVASHAASLPFSHGRMLIDLIRMVSAFDKISRKRGSDYC